MDSGKPVHTPVMMREVLAFINPEPGQTIIDCTVGAGGHAARMLEAITPGGKLVGLDRDAEILEIARENLETIGGNFELHHERFSEAATVSDVPVDAMLFDLGVSSLQIERPERGFSFLVEGPLDMRMDQTHGFSAADALRKLGESDLETVIREYGEERYARRIARTIKHALKTRDIRTTGELAEIVERATPHTGGRIHPATRTFQALRIYVNRELDELEEAMQKTPELLKPGGRVVVISYHSLEDRIVKQAFREHKRQGLLEILTGKPVRPDAAEVRRNRRSRSARLRAARRL